MRRRPEPGKAGLPSGMGIGTGWQKTVSLPLGFCWLKGVALKMEKNPYSEAN